MKVFVTGGLGQIGSLVTGRLLNRGDEVLVLDNLATGRREHLESHPSLRISEGSIADFDLLSDLFAEFKPDSVVHAAASFKDPDNWTEDISTNVMGGANLVRLAREFDARRFIYLQTSLCYGLNPAERPITLSHPRTPAGSSYAITKSVVEDFMALSGIDSVTFRLANVVGPRNLAGPLPIFYRRLKAGQRCFVSSSRRDFVFGDDLAQHIVMALDGVGNGAYHFSSGKDVAIEDLYFEMGRAMQLEEIPEPDRISPGADDVESLLLDPSRTIRDFGEFDHTPLAEIVRQAVRYFDEFGVDREVTHLRID